MAQNERSTRELLALILEKGRSNPHLGEVLEKRFDPKGRGRNLNEPLSKHFKGGGRGCTGRGGLPEGAC